MHLPGQAFDGVTPPAPAGVPRGMGPPPPESGPSDITRALDKADSDISKLLEDLRQIQINADIGRFGKYYIANFMFLLVLVGIELDMAGLFMSSSTYWDYDVAILNVLLVFFAISFVAPLAIQTWVGLSEDTACSLDENSRGWTETQGIPKKNKGPSSISSFMGSLKTAVRAANPHGGRMEIYHWVPGVRFYLIVKQAYDLTDVDAIFKVNTLSSFTLGIYQLLGILSTVVLEKPLTIYVWLNVVSQFLNWGITILYFTTPVSKWMGNAANARSMSRHYQGIMNAFAAQLQLQAGSISSEEGDFQKARQQIQIMKQNVGLMVLDQFFPHECKGKNDADAILKTMRDQDMKEFILLLRNQAMSSIDMAGGI